MKRLRRPSLSDSRPKNSAPTTSPARYTVATKPTAVEDNASVSGWVSVSATELATVISRPSRIQATPSATTMRVWNGDHGSRSIRAGMMLRITPGASAGAVMVASLRAGQIVEIAFPRRSHRKPSDATTHRPPESGDGESLAPTALSDALSHSLFWPRHQISNDDALDPVAFLARRIAAGAAHQ